MEEIIVNVNNLYKKIKDDVILNNITFQVKKGEICGIIGRNGSGKSMLFKSICGLINPTSGSIEVFKKPIINGAFPDNFGAIIEHPGFLPKFSAFNNLKYLASIKNIISDNDIKESIKRVGLDPNNKKSVKTYSLGMKQRLGIAQAIMEKPKLLILDEPMNGLDKEGVALIRNLFIELKREGVTILMSSHNSDDINILCDKVYEMDNGILSII